MLRRGRRGRGRWAAGDFEDAVRFFNEKLKILVGKVAVRVELFEFGGFGFGAGLAIFLKVESFAGGASHGVNQAGEDLGIAAELFVEATGSNMTEGQEDLGGGELESGFVEFAGVEIGEEIQSGLLVGAG